MATAPVRRPTARPPARPTAWQRKLLVQRSSVGGRQSLYLTPEALDIDDTDSTFITRRRVLWDEVRLVTLHRQWDPGTLLLILGLVVLLVLVSGLLGRSSGMAGAIFALCSWVPLGAYLAARLHLGAHSVCVFGRRTKARADFGLRPARAREAYLEICRRVRQAQAGMRPAGGTPSATGAQRVMPPAGAAAPPAASAPPPPEPPSPALTAATAQRLALGRSATETVTADRPSFFHQAGGTVKRETDPTSRLRFGASKVEMDEDGLRAWTGAREPRLLPWAQVAEVAVRMLPTESPWDRAVFFDLVPAPDAAGAKAPPVRITRVTAMNFRLLPGTPAADRKENLRRLALYVLARNPAARAEAESADFVAGRDCVQLRTAAQIVAFDTRYD